MYDINSDEMISARKRLLDERDKVLQLIETFSAEDVLETSYNMLMFSTIYKLLLNDTRLCSDKVVDLINNLPSALVGELTIKCIENEVFDFSILDETVLKLIDEL